jgi:hypothetical protein
MNLRDRIELHFMLRRADNVIRHAYIEREQLNRPHVPSVHMIGHWTPPPAPTARDYGVTPGYVAALLILFGLVIYFNVYHPQEMQKLSCFQLASK